jgi:hypothetical protein
MFKKYHLWILVLWLAPFFAGAASNQAVLLANHDTFPVMVNNTKLDEALGDDRPTPKDLAAPVMLDDIHCVMTDKTHLNFLADVFDYNGAIQSVGDLGLDFGAWFGTFAPFLWGFAMLKDAKD